jgi:putative tryptophan/tyrosine transport system substrate-binding protein
MKRRDFITLFGGAAAWPLAARAQQPSMPVIGFVYFGSSGTITTLIAAFQNGLAETGHFEGLNVKMEYRWAQYQPDRLPEIMAELVRQHVAVIAAPGALSPSLAAKAATTSIPIVFSTGADPVKAGLVASLNLPGGNVTGISYMNIEIGAKRLGLLNELVRGDSRLAVLVDPSSFSTGIVKDLRMAASKIGRQIEPFVASSPREVDLSFGKIVEKRCGGLLVAPLPLFFDLRLKILALAARYAIPSIYPAREWVEAGGIMSYGSSFADQFRQAGIYTGRILNGKTPAELPVLQATKFELVINLQTAQALGVEIPANLLTIADEVIE